VVRTGQGCDAGAVDEAIDAEGAGEVRRVHNEGRLRRGRGGVWLCASAALQLLMRGSPTHLNVR
jgi:hypothetical protein